MADVVFGSHDNSTLFGSTIHYICTKDGSNSKSTSTQSTVVLSHIVTQSSHEILDYEIRT